MKGETEKAISVMIMDDDAYEEDEDFFIELSNACCADPDYEAGMGRHNSIRISIVDDDEPGVLAFEKDTLHVTEGLEEKVISVIVTRNNGSSGRVTCKYRTEDSSATAGRDYEQCAGTLTFLNNQTSV